MWKSQPSATPVRSPGSPNRIRWCWCRSGRASALGGLAVPEDGAARYVPLAAAGPLLEAIGDDSRQRVAHDAKDLLRHLVEQGLPVDGPLFDTALAAYVVQPATRTYDLGELSLRYLGIQLGPGEEGDRCRERPGDARLLGRPRRRRCRSEGGGHRATGRRAPHRTRGAGRAGALRRDRGAAGGGPRSNGGGRDRGRSALSRGAGRESP